MLSNKLHWQFVEHLRGTCWTHEISLTPMLANLQSLLAAEEGYAENWLTAKRCVAIGRMKVRWKVSGLSFQTANLAIMRGKVCYERQTGTSLHRVCVSIDR